jgi:hypothetical protein
LLNFANIKMLKSYMIILNKKKEIFIVDAG